MWRASSISVRPAGGFTDAFDLGFFPLQDHASAQDGTPTAARQMLVGGRITRMTDPADTLSFSDLDDGGYTDSGGNRYVGSSGFISRAGVMRAKIHGATYEFQGRPILPEIPTLWLAADDADGANSGTLANSDALAAWRDKSGAARDYSQATAANQPLFKTNIQNGLPGILFDGTNDQLDSVATTADFELLLQFRVVVLAEARRKVDLASDELEALLARLEVERLTKALAVLIPTEHLGGPDDG